MLRQRRDLLYVVDVVSLVFGGHAFHGARY
jgi:hypothetical protein